MKLLRLRSIFQIWRHKGELAGVNTVDELLAVDDIAELFDEERLRSKELASVAVVSIDKSGFVHVSTNEDTVYCMGLLMRGIDVLNSQECSNEESVE